MYYLLLYLIYGIQTSLYCPLPPPSLSHLYRFHTLRLAPHPTARVPLSLAFSPVGAESDQHVNICSFAVRCDRRWHSTQ